MIATGFAEEINKNYPYVCILVLNYNGRGIIERCLESVSLQDYPNYEIIAIDNASSDDSVQILKRLMNDVRMRLVLNKRNLGYTGGLNEGFKLVPSKAKFVGIVTHDVILSHDWVRSMVNLMIKDNSIAAISSRIYDLKSRTIISELRIVYPCGWYYVPKNRELGIHEIDFPSGEAFFIRRNIFERVGGFDQDYFGYYDDADLGWRIRLLGFKVVHNPKANASHERSYSFGKLPRYVHDFLFHRNRIMSCLKNLEAKSLPAFLIGEVLTLAIWFTIFILMKRRDERFKGYALALIHVLRTRKRILLKRKLVQDGRKIRDRDIFKNSLPLSFFLTGLAYVHGRTGLLLLNLWRLTTHIFHP